MKYNIEFSDNGATIVTVYENLPINPPPPPGIFVGPWKKTIVVTEARSYNVTSTGIKFPASTIAPQLNNLHIAVQDLHPLLLFSFPLGGTVDEFKDWLLENKAFHRAGSAAGTTTPVEPQPEPYIRPVDWLPIDNLVIEGQQKFVGLHAVNEFSNFVSLSAEGNYTVDWGDGIVENYASGIQAYHEFLWNNHEGTESERGYRQVIVTVTPQIGHNLTNIDLHKKHNKTGLPLYSSGWMDIVMSSPYLESLTISKSSQIIRFDSLESFKILGNNLLLKHYILILLFKSIKSCSY
jgi:hypothetical protein